MFLFLTLVVFLAGCQTEDPYAGSDGFVPVGVWVSDYDSYTITSTHVDYVFDMSEWGLPNDVLKGSIERAVNFSDNAGVLIIKITEASYNTVDKYTGIYYRNYSSSTINLSTAIDADFSPIEADTLFDALFLFNAGNAGTHVSMWGVYTK